MPTLPPETRRLLPELFRRIAVPYAPAFAAEGRSALANVVAVALGGAHAAPKHAVHIRLGTAAGIKPSSKEKHHLDEFAVAFGFLEESGSTYFAGKFGLASHLIETLSMRHNYFDRDRAQAAIFLYALLERHGDCVLPYLAEAEDRQGSADSFRAKIRASLALKVSRFMTADLPRNATFHEAVKALRRHEEWWNVNSPEREKTMQGYLGRTTTYCSDLGLTVGRERSLTSTGSQLCRAWRDATGEDRAPLIEIPPSFESIHDAFSVDWHRYARAFAPQVAADIFERAINATLLPHAMPKQWSSEDLDDDYLAIVSTISEPLSGAARVDAVRLGLFVLGIATGRPFSLGDPPDADGYDPNAQAAVLLGLAHPRRFLMGHARSGRRFWTVALVRR